MIKCNVAEFQPVSVKLARPEAANWYCVPGIPRRGAEMWPFKMSKKPLALIAFASGKDFVSYHLQMHDNAVSAGIASRCPRPGCQRTFGTKEAVATNDRGIQTATLRVASDDGGFVVIAETSGPGEPLEPGDAVAWIPEQYMLELGRVSGDERTGWIGLIVAKVAPEIDMNKSEMRILCRY